jgi:hypothetical protein
MHSVKDGPPPGVCGRLRAPLGAVLALGAVPHGYTLATWATSAELARRLGLPSEPEVLLYVLAAAAGYGSLSLLARPSVADAAAPSFPGVLSAPVAAGTSALATLVASALPATAQWPVASLAVTVAYFGALGLVGAWGRRGW